METHFDNPKKITGRVDRSGIRLHFSDKPRQFEMGTLQLGDSFVSRIGQIVRSDKPYVHTCPSECTRGFSQNITVFDSFLHMHRTGEETYINLFSENGTFLQTLHQVRSTVFLNFRNHINPLLRFHDIILTTIDFFRAHNFVS